MKVANIRILIGFALAFGIGVLCRLAGYAITDRFAGQALETIQPGTRKSKCCT
jgi:hypothetical protein